MRRLLLVTYRDITQQGGAAARWRAFARYLPEHGWEVEVVAAPERTSAVEFTEDEAARARVARRARAMGTVGRAAAPVFGLAGVRPEAVPPSMAWVARGSRAIRRRLESGNFDAVLATGPPMAALGAARAAIGGGGPPWVAELRDLWAGSPAFDVRGRLLTRIQERTLASAAAIVAVTPEAADDLRRRHPALADRVQMIPNGFEPELLERRSFPLQNGGGSDPLTVIHSGILGPGRSVRTLLEVLERQPYRDAFRLILHGYLTPEIAAEVAGSAAEIVPPSSWEDAVDRIAAADIGLIVQGRAVGDATAIASKAYEYLALGKPVLAITDGGATEALLRRLGADRHLARLDEPASIAAALDRLREEPLPDPLPPAALAPFDRRRLAGRMAALLDDLAAPQPAGGSAFP